MAGPAQRLFNRRLKRFRVWIEHTFGEWKSRFPMFLFALRKDKLEYCQATIIGKKHALKNIIQLMQFDILFFVKKIHKGCVVLRIIIW